MIKLTHPGFYVRVVNKASVESPKGWKLKGRKISNPTSNPRDNDIAEVIDIDIYTDGTRCFLCKDIDDFTFAINESDVELFGKNWSETAERIKKEYSIA